MNKELEAFVRLEQNSKRYKGRKQDLDIVFAALKEKEQQDSLIRVLKEVFEFGIINEKVIEKDDGSLTLLGQVGYNLRREISNKEKTLYRDFILKKCFPKELKALEIITSISKQTTHFRLKERQNFGEDETSYYLVIDNCEYRLKDKEEYDLLKEVLL